MVVDTLLASRVDQGDPIRVGLVGAGVAARAIALHLVDAVPGIRLIAIANRTVAHAKRAFAEAGYADVAEVSSPEAMDRAIERGQRAVTADPAVLCESTTLDVMVEATGTIEFAARVICRALERAKPVVMANAELDATVGPSLALRARRQGLVLTNTDGDEPGVIVILGPARMDYNVNVGLLKYINHLLK